MKHYAGQKLVAGVISQPGEVAGVVDGGCGGGLDLEGDQAPRVQFRDDVYLVAPVRVYTVVIQYRGNGPVRYRPP